MRWLVRFSYRLSTQWLAHDNTPAAAAIAFYTIFSLAPTLIIAVVIAGWVFGPGQAEAAASAWLEQQIGADGARVVRTVLENAEHTERSVLPTALGVVVLVYGASLVFVQLCSTLNRIMGAGPLPDAASHHHIWAFVRGRLLAVVFVLAVGCIILALLVANTAFASLGQQASRALGVHVDTVRYLGPVLSFLIAGLLFFSLMAFLPHGGATWRHIWPGALVAAVLFEVGKIGISWYLGQSTVASAYGASGSFVAVVLWVYYSAHIFLFGAEIARYNLDRSRERAAESAASSLISASGARRVG